MSKGWDTATLKKLKALTGKGLSTSEIGKRLGVSKNAIVGKLNRMGWNLKAISGVSSPSKVGINSVATVKKTKTQKNDVIAKGSTKATTLGVKKGSSTVSAKTNEKENVKVKIPRVSKISKIEESKVNIKTNGKTLAVHQRIVQHALEMAALKSNQCRWPIGDPDSENFHFCGKQTFIGKPYCYEHCKQAYQFTPPKKR